MYVNNIRNHSDPIMSSLKTYSLLQLDPQKLDKHIRGKWLIHDTKQYKDNQLQNMSKPFWNVSKL